MQPGEGGEVGGEVRAWVAVSVGFALPVAVADAGALGVGDGDGVDVRAAVGTGSAVGSNTPKHLPAWCSPLRSTAQGAWLMVTAVGGVDTSTVTRRLSRAPSRRPSGRMGRRERGVTRAY